MFPAPKLWSMYGFTGLPWARLQLMARVQFPFYKAGDFSLFEEGITVFFAFGEGFWDGAEAQLFESCDFWGDEGVVGYEMGLKSGKHDLGWAIGCFHSCECASAFAA